MLDRPSGAELIEAVREFLANEVVPSCTDPRLKFRTLIAANVLAVAGRELANEHAVLEAAQAHLRPLIGEILPDRHPGESGSRAAVEQQLRALSAAIRAGSYDHGQAWQSAFDFALWQVEAKLAVANPAYLRDIAHRQQKSSSPEGG